MTPKKGIRGPQAESHSVWIKFFCIQLLKNRDRFGQTADSGTDTGRYEIENVNNYHSMIGTSVRFQKFFAVIELDRYTQSVLSAKLGFRF